MRRKRRIRQSSRDGTRDVMAYDELLDAFADSLSTGSYGPYQPLDADLTALAALASTGALHRTASNTYALRTLTGPAAGLAVADGDGVAGNPTLSLADDLAALEALATAGLAARTAASTWTTRTLTGPAAGITVADGDGVAGNPTLSLANDLAAVEGLASTGLAVRDGLSSWTTRTLTGPAAGLSVTNGDGVAGNPTLALANDLAAVEAMLDTGIVSRTADSTWTAATGTDNRVVRWDGTTEAQDSAVEIDDTGNVLLAASTGLYWSTTGSASYLKAAGSDVSLRATGALGCTAATDLSLTAEAGSVYITAGNPGGDIQLLADDTGVLKFYYGNTLTSTFYSYLAGVGTRRVEIDGDGDINLATGDVVIEDLTGAHGLYWSSEASDYYLRYNDSDIYLRSGDDLYVQVDDAHYYLSAFDGVSLGGFGWYFGSATTAANCKAFMEVDNLALDTTMVLGWQDMATSTARAAMFVLTNDLYVLSYDDLHIQAQATANITGTALTVDVSGAINLDAGTDVLVKYGGTAWATFDGSAKTLIVDNTGTTGPSEALRADYSADTAVGTNQYYLACYDNSGLVGGISGTGSTTGLAFRNEQGNLALATIAGGQTVFQDVTTTFCSVTKDGSGGAIIDAPSGDLNLTVASTSKVRIDGGTGAHSQGVLDVRRNYAGTEGVVAYMQAESSTTTNGRVLVCTAGGVSNPASTFIFVDFRDGSNARDGSISATGSGGVAYNVTSDAREKVRVRPLGIDAAAVVRGVRARRWNSWRNPDGPDGFGWVAQEVAPLLPHAVTEMADGGGPDGRSPALQLDVMSLLPVLWEHAHEMRDEVEELKALLTAALVRITALESAAPPP